MNVFDVRMAKSGALQKLKDAGIIVFVRSIFLQGLFFMDPEQVPGSLTSTSGLLKKLHELAERECLSIAQLALSFIRDIESVTGLVIGSETSEQVADNIKLMESPGFSCDTAAKIRRLSEVTPIETIMNELILRRGVSMKRQQEEWQKIHKE